MDDGPGWHVHAAPVGPDGFLEAGNNANENKTSISLESDLVSPNCEIAAISKVCDTGDNNVDNDNGDIRTSSGSRSSNQ